MIHTDLQICAIRENHADLESDYRSSRKDTLEMLSEYGGAVGVNLSQLYVMFQKLQSDISSQRVVSSFLCWSPVAKLVRTRASPLSVFNAVYYYYCCASNYGNVCKKVGLTLQVDLIQGLKDIDRNLETIASSELPLMPNGNKQPVLTEGK